MSSYLRASSSRPVSHLSPPHGQCQHTPWYWYSLWAAVGIRYAPVRLVSEHLVPSCWCRLVEGYGTFRWSPAGGSASLQVGSRSLQALSPFSLQSLGPACGGTLVSELPAPAACCHTVFAIMDANPLKPYVKINASLLKSLGHRGILLN